MRFRLLETIIVILLFLLICPKVFPQNSDDVALMLKVKGGVQVKKASPRNWFAAKRGLHLDSGDMVRTSNDGLAALVFTDDKSLLKIRSNSEVTIKGQREKTTISKKLSVMVGQIWAKVTKQSVDFVVETPSGIATVKGTEFYLLVDSSGNTIVITIEGLINLLNDLGSVLVGAGQTGFLNPNEPPTVHDSDSSQIPNWGNQGGAENELEFEFQDQDGNKKTLKIFYKTP